MDDREEADVLFGRDGERQQLADADAPLVVVAGDSGMGKTALVSAGQRDLGGVAPAPVRVRSSPGSLQRALLDAISSGVQLVESGEGPMGRAVRLADAVAVRMAQQGLSDLATAVGEVIRHQVAHHLGEDALRVADAAYGTLRKSEAQELRRRIAAGGDVDVVEVALRFASELRTMAGSDVTLALDDVHKLDDDDHRRLLDLRDTAPEGVRIRATFSKVPSAGDCLLELQANGASIIELGALDEGAVGAWAEEESLDPGVVGRVMAITAGVPFHVNDAFALLAAFDDFDLSRLAHDDVVRYRTLEAWGALDDAERKATSLLAPLADEVSNGRAAQILGLDEADWFVLRARLIEAGLFLADTRWFHELRRRCLLDDVLEADQVAAAQRVIVERSVELLDARPDSELDLLGCIRVLGVMADTARLVVGDRRGVAAVLDCSRDDLRTLAAIVELSDRPEPGKDANPDQIVLARTVVSHLAGLETPVDAVPILSRLNDVGLTGMIEGGDQVGVWPTFPSEASWWLTQGRSVVELGRWPISRLGAAVFDVAVRPVLESFHRAQRGVGPAGLAALADEGRQMQREPRNGRVLVSDGWPSLIVRGRYSADVPIWAVVAYDRFADREAALERVGELGVVDIVGSPFTVEALYGFPGYALPLNRFASTYAEVVRAGPGSVDHQHIELSEVARRIKAFHELVRRHTTAQEQQALGVVNPMGVRFAADDASYMFVEIHNDDTVQQLDTDQVAWPSTPQEWLTFDHRLGLEPGKHHGMCHGGASEQPRVGVSGATHTPITYAHVTLAPGAQLAVPWAPAFNAFAYALTGQGTVGAEGRPLAEGQLAVLGDGEHIVVAAHLPSRSTTCSSAGCPSGLRSPTTDRSS